MKRYGGPEGARTPDLFNAIEARSQLRHRPTDGIIKPSIENGCQTAERFSFYCSALFLSHLRGCALFRATYTNERNAREAEPSSHRSLGMTAMEKKATPRQALRLRSGYADFTDGKYKSRSLVAALARDDSKGEKAHGKKSVPWLPNRPAC